MSGTSASPAALDDEAEIGRLEARWLALGLSTEPADRPAAESAIADLYRAVGLTPPGRCLWAPSPLQGAAAAMLAQLLSPWMPERVRQAEWQRQAACAPGELLAFIRDIVARHGSDESWEPLRRPVWATTGRGLPPEIVWGFTAGDWLPTLARLKHVFGVEVGARACERLERMYARLREGPIAGIMRELGRAVDRRLWVPHDHVQFGQHDAARAAVAEYLGGRAGAMKPATTPRIRDAMIRLAESCGWWWPYRGAAILSERPRRLRLDAAGRLHAGDGPAIEYPDGWGVYAWHGQEVPARLIMEPDTITAAEVLAEENLERRRIMLERMGYARFILESGARPLHADDAGTLYRIDLPNEEPLVLAHVINATPEPDGSQRRYFLRVPPRMQRARQAVAWTFGLTERQYRPARET